MPDQPTPATPAAALAELAAMRRIVTVLDRLEGPAQARVIRWLSAAYGTDQQPTRTFEDVAR